MRNIIVISVIAIFTFMGCKEKKSHTDGGNIRISWSNETLKSLTNENIDKILISIENEEGINVYELEEIEIYKFNDEYISEPISLKTGIYNITEFLVVDDEDQVVYVTPKVGSELDYLVNNPLPVSFGVYTNEITKVSLEVVSVKHGNPKDFGYVTFQFNFVPSDMMVGLMDNKLFSINTETADIEMIAQLDDTTGLVFSRLTYGVDRLYTMLNTTTEPAIYEITLDGHVSFIGPLTYNGDQILLSEAIAYNEKDGNLYVSASLNGGTAQGDYYSESIMMVNPETGECSLVCEIKNNNLNPVDLDAMEIVDNILYYYDGAPPGSNYTRIYSIDLDNVCSTILDPVFQTRYTPVIDLAIKDQALYYIQDKSLYTISIEDQSMNFIGTTHGSDEYNNQNFYGIAYIKGSEQ